MPSKGSNKWSSKAGKVNNFVDDRLLQIIISCQSLSLISVLSGRWRRGVVDLLKSQTVHNNPVLTQLVNFN